MPLDEMALRRPTIDLENSHPVTMGDAQVWHLPKPFARMRRPIFRDGRADAAIAVTDDPVYNALLAEIEEKDTFLSIANMAAFLLLKNYELTDEQLGDILQYDPEDKSPERWPVQAIAVAFGQTGKKA